MGHPLREWRWASVLVVLLALAATAVMLAHGVEHGDWHAHESHCAPCRVIDAVSTALLVPTATVATVSTHGEPISFEGSTLRVAATYVLLPQRAPPAC